MGAMRGQDLEAAVRAGILSAEQAERLAAFLAAARDREGGDRPRFTLVHVLYYLGGMIAVGAMSLFMTLNWKALGGWGGFTVALCYLVLFLALTHRFMTRAQLAIPAGIMATLTVVMVPLAIFAAQMALGYWGADRPYRDYHQFIDGRWLLMELGTLAAGAVLLWRYRFPFMVMPIAVTLWYMSMDLVPLLFGAPWQDWEIRKFISLWFGLAMTLLAFWVDVRSRFSRDYAFWLYVFGVLTFWGGLSLMDSHGELAKLGYCAINLAMILLGALLARRVFAVFGGLGVAGYLGHLAWRVFPGSSLFPPALAAIGLAIVWAGMLWHRSEAAWTARLRARLPAPVRELLEARAAQELASS